MNYKIIILSLLFGCFVFFGCSEVKNKKLKESKIETEMIGKQEWMKNNLDVDHYRNGDSIPEVREPKEWAKLTTGAWCYYKNNPKNNKKYGKLYNWYAVNDPRGLAPEGWHIPSDIDWSDLTEFLDELVRDYWNNTESETNPSGKVKESPLSKYHLTKDTGGYRNYDGSYNASTSYGTWWSSSAYDTVQTFKRCSMFSSNTLFGGQEAKWYGFSVRCIKN